MFTTLSNFRAKIGVRLSELSSPIRVALFATGLILGTVVLFWLFNQMFYYVVAKSYADELSQTYNLNRGFTKALVWASFAAVVSFAGCAFSFSKRKRTVGYVGILGLLIGHGILLGLRDANFDTAGRTEKCYVIARGGIRLLNHVGIDPDSGHECRALTRLIRQKAPERLASVA